MPESHGRLMPSELPDLEPSLREVPPRRARLGTRSRVGVADGALLGFDVLLMLVLGGLSSVPTHATGLWWLQILGVAGLAWRVSRAGVARAAFLGWCFGLAWVVAGTWWLFISMHRYGGLSAPLAAMAVVALGGFLALYLAGAMALFARMRRNRAWLDPLLFTACWLLAEWLRARLFTGFPWAVSGYAQIDGPLAVLAPWMGVYGMGAVSALLAAAVVFGARSSTGPVAGGVVGLLFGAVTLALMAMAPRVEFTRPTSTLSVSLLQSNVPQDEKFATERLPESLAWAAREMLGARSDLVVAPETVIPLLPDQLAPEYWRPLQKHFHGGASAALIGRPLGSFEEGYTNSAVGVSRDTVKLPQGMYRYDKHHLVPFGEFIPSGFRWFTNLMNIPLGDFNRGGLVQPTFDVRGERVAPNICYEDLFGEELAARFGVHGATPTVFANLSNIGWFGDTIALAQHLHISRMRALEFQVPMLRATNTGTTAVIDHAGVVTHALPTHTRAVLAAEVQGREGRTPYAVWVSRHGLWPLVGLAGVLLLLAVPLRRRAD